MYKILIYILLFTITSSALGYAENRLVFGGIEGSINNKIGVAILEEAYETIGHSVTFRTYPAKRSLLMSNSGMIDGEVQRVDGISSDYPDLIKIAVPLFELVGCVYTKKVFMRIEGWDSLKPYTIGIRRGVKYAEEGTEGLKRLIVETEKQQLILLQIGRVDLIVSNHFAIEQCINKLNLKDIKRLQPPIVQEPLFHYIHSSET